MTTFYKILLTASDSTRSLCFYSLIHWKSDMLLMKLNFRHCDCLSKVVVLEMIFIRMSSIFACDLACQCFIWNNSLQSSLHPGDSLYCILPRNISIYIKIYPGQIKSNFIFLYPCQLMDSEIQLCQRIHLKHLTPAIFTILTQTFLRLRTVHKWCYP